MIQSDAPPLPAPASGWITRIELLSGLTLTDTRVAPMTPQALKALQDQRRRDVPLYRQLIEELASPGSTPRR